MKSLRSAMMLFVLSSLFSGYAQVATYHNDNSRSGQNINETILTPTNVNVNHVKFTVPTIINGKVYVPAVQKLSVYGLLGGKGTK